MSQMSHTQYFCGGAVKVPVTGGYFVEVAACSGQHDRSLLLYVKLHRLQSASSQG
jgi:hypothetical protein